MAALSRPDDPRMWSCAVLWKLNFTGAHGHEGLRIAGIRVTLFGIFRPNRTAISFADKPEDKKAIPAVMMIARTHLNVTKQRNCVETIQYLISIKAALNNRWYGRRWWFQCISHNKPLVLLTF